MVHFYHKSDCLKNAYWKDNGLYCAKCGEMLAHRYYDPEDGLLKIKTFPPFSKFREEIEKWC